MEKGQWKQVVGIFLVTFLVSVYTLRDIKDPTQLVRYAFEKQAMGFINSIFASLGYLSGIGIYNYLKNKKR